MLFDYDARSGRLTTRQTISTLPPGFAGSNFCSEILVSADGRYVYAGNRLHDSIGIFSVGSDGAPDVRRRRMDTRRLSSQLQLRSDGPLPLLLQPASRRDRRLPRRPRDRQPVVYGPVRPRRQSVEHCVRRPREDIRFARRDPEESLIDQPQLIPATSDFIPLERERRSDIHDAVALPRRLLVFGGACAEVLCPVRPDRERTAPVVRPA